MPQSLARVLVHIVYSTKNRQAWLSNEKLRSELYAYNSTVLNNDVDSPAILINGVDDHLHVLCQLSRKFPMMDVVKASKTETTKWLKKQDASFREFQWQAGYGAFSVSESNIEQVKQYIARQEEHHKRMSYQDEFRALCGKHGIDIDERYVWD